MFCGIDWSDDHHDVAVVDDSGVAVAQFQISNDAGGFAQLVETLTGVASGAGREIPVAIETAKGLLVASLIAEGWSVFPINPLATSRYRDRHRSGRGKSDASDAFVLANILRTDLHAHRRMPADGELVRALRVLTRAQQDAVGDRMRMTNRIRGVLKQFFPAAIEAFERGGKHRLDSAACRTILAATPTPGAARRLTLSQLRSLLRRAGRSRGIDAEATKLRGILRNTQLQQPQRVEEAMGAQLVCLLGQLDAICSSVDTLTTAVETLFAEHHQASVFISFPGAGALTAARLLAEIGDDAARFGDARALRAYAGAAPITRASGKSHWVGVRRAKNDRLAATGYVWAMAAIRHDTDARAHYQRRRDHGDHHVAALRNLFNKLIGKLHHCLINDVVYDPKQAFATATRVAA
jgi:transposase